MVFSRYWIKILIILLGFTACGVPPTLPPPSPLPPNIFTERFLTLDNSTATKLIEISSFADKGHIGHIAQVKYVSDVNRVLGVNSDDGYVLAWDVDSASIVETYDIGVVSQKSLTFSPSGHSLMGATWHRFVTGESNYEIEYIAGIALWDMNTGKMVKCVISPCQNSKGGDYLGAIIDPAGQWVATYSAYSVGKWNLTGNALGGLTLVNSDLSDYWWNIGAVVFDAVHTRYALVFQEGGLWLSTGNDILPSHSLVEGKKNDLRDVIAAKFDPTGHWLAFIRDNQMSVWQIGKTAQQLYLETDVPNAVTLSFDQTGNLLFVGADDKITIWDIENKNVVAEYTTLGITSLQISEDNRLVIWGDAQGGVHLWGIPLHK